MKNPRVLLICLVVLACFFGGLASAYHIGKDRATREFLDAANYDRIREVAFQGFFVAADRDDIFFRSCDVVIERYAESGEIEERLKVEPREREITERLVVQYYFAQDREIPPAILRILRKSWDRESFVFTKENGKKIK